MGIFFSTVPIWQANNWTSPLPNWSAVAVPYPVTDTSSWVLVSGVFIPDSAYTYVLVGNSLSAS